jgi:crotonobetainyl-CoA:carnitine CoA-transferase CaiB-like acyl-CoA transferase
MIPEALLEQSLNGRAPIRRGNRDARFCPHDVFRCRGEDAWIAVSVESDAEWLALARVLGRGDWAREGRYATADQRERQAAEIGKTIESWTLDRDARVLAEELQRAGVRAVKALNTEELLRDHRSLLRHLLVAIDHPVTGLRPILGFPGRFGRFEYRCRAAPLMGADTEGVLREVLNMSAGEIRQLQNDGVTY